jgi:hypothetical protein
MRHAFLAQPIGDASIRVDRQNKFGKRARFVQLGSTGGRVNHASGKLANSSAFLGRSINRLGPAFVEQANTSSGGFSLSEDIPDLYPLKPVTVIFLGEVTATDSYDFAILAYAGNYGWMVSLPLWSSTNLRMICRGYWSGGASAVNVPTSAGMQIKMLGWAWDAGASNALQLQCYVNGVSVGTSSSGSLDPSTTPTGAPRFSIQSYTSFNSGTPRKNLMAVFAGKFSPAEMLEYYANPWQIFRRRIDTFVSSSGPSAALESTAVGQGAAAGTLTTSIRVIGASVAASIAGGALTTAIRPSAAAAAAGVAAGGLTTGIRPAVTAAASVTATGILTTTITLQVAAIAQALAVGGITTSVLLAGGASAAGSVAGELTTTPGGLVGAAMGRAGSAADLTTSVWLSGAAVAQALVTAALTTGSGLSSAAIAQALGSGQLATAVRLAAGALALGAATADLLTTPAGTAGAAVGRGQVTGSLQTAVRMTGAPSAFVTAAGELDTGVRLAGTPQSTAAATGTLVTGIPLAGATAAVSQATGALLIDLRMTGAALATALAGGALSAQIQLDAAAVAQALAVGALTLGLADRAPPNRTLAMQPQNRRMKVRRQVRLLETLA